MEQQEQPTLETAATTPPPPAAATKKKKWKAYVLWLFGGYFGLHHLYLGRDRQAFAYWCTLGGGFGFLRDVYRIPAYVAEANEDAEYMETLAQKMETKNKPPFSMVRFCGEVLVGYVFGAVFYCSIPFEGSNYYGISLWWFTFLTPLAISIGVHTVGNIGHERGKLKSVFYSSVLSYLLSYNSMPQGTFWVAVSAAATFAFRSRKWRRKPSPKYGTCRRISVLLGCGLVYCSLLASAVYFNAEFVDKNGEQVKVRDAAMNFLNSPMWEEIKDSFQQLYDFYKIYGWQKLAEQFIDQLDPHGERRAKKVLGLSDSATKPEVVARWRQLSKEWHPDRHKDAAMKEEAHQRFMEYQDAYQKLIKIRAKVEPEPARTDTDSKIEL